MRVGVLIGVLVIGAWAGAVVAEDGSGRDYLAERAALVDSVVADNPRGAPIWERVEETFKAVALSETRIVESLRFRHELPESVEIDIDPLVLLDAPPEGEAGADDAQPEEGEGGEAAPPDIEALRVRAARTLFRSYDSNRWFERFVLLRTQPLIRVPLDGRPLALRDLWFAEQARTMAALEGVRVWNFLDEGEATKAANSFDGILSLAVVLSREPTMIGRLSAIEVFDVAYSVVHKRIELHGLGGEAAEQMLDAAERRLFEFTPLSYTLAGERLTGLDTIDRVFGMGIPAPQVVPPGEASMLRSREENEASMNALYDRAEAWASMRSVERRDAEATPSAFADGAEAGLVLVKIIAPGLDQIAWVDQAMRVRADGLRIMLSLEAYRARHAEYPATLEALSPNFLFEVPNDPYAAEGSYTYMRPANEGAPSYILSSVGYDGTEGKGARPHVEPTLFPGPLDNDADYLIAAPKRRAVQSEPAPARDPSGNE